MGKSARRKQMKHPKKIRLRTEQEIAAVMIAYRNLFKGDPFLANMMLLCSELSEYIPEIQMNDEKKLKVFIEHNMDGLIFQFLRRFKTIDQCAIPLDPLDSPIRLKGNDWVN